MIRSNRTQIIYFLILKLFLKNFLITIQLKWKPATCLNINKRKTLGKDTSTNTKTLKEKYIIATPIFRPILTENVL
jgi:hypothetical protein